MSTETMQRGERHVRRGGIVGPVVLIGAGILFLMANLGQLNWAVWETLFRLWPVLLIAVGLDVLIGRRSVFGSLLIVVLLFGVLAWAITNAGPVTAAGQVLPSETINQALDGAKLAEVELAPGVGELRVGAAGEDAGLIEGQVMLSAGEQAVTDHYKNGDILHFTLRSRGMPAVVWPGNWGSDPIRHHIWDLKLNRNIPITLKLDTGVGQTTVDLSDITVTDLQVNTGVGQSIVTLPKQGRVTAHISGGIGELRVIVPAGMAAKIHVNGGLGETKVEGDFQRQGDDYVSANYGSSANQAELEVNGAIGSITLQGANGG